MRRTLLTVPIAIALAAGASLTAAADTDHRRKPPLSGTVYVTERQVGSVTAFDAASGRPLWTSMTGAVPIGVTRPRGTRKLYTSDEGSNQMSVFDARNGTRLGTIATGPMPHHLMASPDGRRIYVAEFGRATAGVIDTVTDTVVAQYAASPLANARTHAVFIDGKDLYTANTRAVRTEPGDVAHIDARNGTLLCNTPVGVDPSEVLVAPGGRRGYVSVRGESKVKELDLRGRCPVLTGREAVVGTQPDTLQLAPDGTLVITLRGVPARISLLDTRTFAARLVDIPGHMTTGHHWLSRHGRFSFVAVESPAGVAVVDNRSGEVVADHPYPDPPGGSRAHGVFADARTRG